MIVGPAGPDVRLNRWFDSDELGGAVPSTWRKYAYSLIIWLNFLESYGCSWDDATPQAQHAFKAWRVLDERNPATVAPGTYEDNLIALQQFYNWAQAEYDVPNPIRLRRGRGRRLNGAPVERPETAPAATRDRDVKWFDPAGFARYRDVGLMGFTVDGDDDPSFRGRNPQRDGAFAEGLYRTGLRLEEFGSVLLQELPPDDPARQYMTCHLATQTAKGKRYSRPYWMPRRALAEVLTYVEGERASAVHRARQNGRYERMAGARTIVKFLGSRRLRLRDSDGVMTTTSLDSLAPAARRLLLIETDDGLEPAALWLNEDGMPRDPHGWQHTFDTANERLQRLGINNFAGSPHMMRHSFALRWYSVGRLIYQAKVAYLTEDEARDFREQFGNAWDLVQLLLGHRDQQTTKNIYLEPFRALDMELLLVQAAEEAVPALMDSIFREHPRVLTDPLAVQT